MSYEFFVPPIRKNKTIANRVYPVFSQEDNDLNDVKWRMNKKGYAETGRKVNGKVTRFFAHKVVIARMVGRWTDSDREPTDHINRNRLDNRRENLRVSDRFRNGQNRGELSNNTSGYRGVSLRRDCGKWVVQVIHHGKRMYGGLFGDVADAVAKAKQMRKELGFCGEW